MDVGIGSLLIVITSTMLAQISLFYNLTPDIPKWFETIVNIVSTMLIVLGLIYIKDFLLCMKSSGIYEVVCLFSYIIVQLIFAILNKR